DAQKDRNPEQQNVMAQTVTLAATPVEAARLALAADIGQLRLVLKNAGDTSTTAHVIVRASDLNRPAGQAQGAKSDPPGGNAAAPATAPPPLREVDKTPVPVEEPPMAAPVAPPKPRNRHIMTIRQGTQQEKAIFIEGEEDVTSTEAAPPQPQPQPGAA